MLVQRTCQTRRCLKASNGLPKTASTNAVSLGQGHRTFETIGKTMSSKRSMKRLFQDCVKRFKGNATLQRMWAPRSTSIFVRFPFKKEILDIIAAEREVQNKHRHLVVAATGTGKTMNRCV